MQIKLKVLTVLLATFSSIQAVSFLELFSEILAQDQWETFKLRYHKQYASLIEEEFRMQIFVNNMHKIQIHNQKYELGSVSYRLAMNQFGDMPHHEFLQTMCRTESTRQLGTDKLSDKIDYDGITFIPPANVELPKSVDWRDNGAVTPVKDQKESPSWCFSATGALEGREFRKNGKLFDNSERLCRFMPRYVNTIELGFTLVTPRNEQDLQAAVATIGPIAVAIDASDESFQFYSEGVYDEPHCNATNLNLDVLAVGYGTTKTGVDYWLVKNSWGRHWGENGYILMTRNKNNQCGIATKATYPLI